MRILMLAPQPFYVERGTPIAVDLLLRQLSDEGHDVDLLTYHLGNDRDYAGVRIVRIKPWPRINDVPIGFSAAKVYSDLFMFRESISLMRRKRYDVVYAVEEAVFIATLLRQFFGVEYVYDMDSSMSSQLIDTHKWLAPMRRPMEYIESLAIGRAALVVPMCDALAEKASRYRSEGIHVLRDVSLQREANSPPAEDLRRELGLQGRLVMYIGNLQRYQGIDLLLESFTRALESKRDIDLVVVGGHAPDIEHYTEQAACLGIGNRVHFVGPRPVDAIGAYMAQADILVSPRLSGTNTPMKIYSYMDSGRALLATDLWTHTQVLDETTAALAAPEVGAFADAMVELLENPERRRCLAESARSVVAKRHSLTAFADAVTELMSTLEQRLTIKPRQRRTNRA